MTPVRAPIPCPCGDPIILGDCWPRTLIEAHPVGSEIQCWRCKRVLVCTAHEEDGEQDADGAHDASRWAWAPIDTATIGAKQGELT